MMTATATRASRSPRRTATRASTFEPDLIRRLRQAEEIRIKPEDVRGPGTWVIIWVVTLGRSAYVRSYLGSKGRWYRGVLKGGNATIQVARKRIAVRALREKDPTVIERVNAAYRRKYGRYQETDAMLKPSVAATTLRLVPA